MNNVPPKTKPNPWETFKTDREILTSVVGKTFGEEPEKRLDEIIAGRANHANFIVEWLGLEPNDIVVDLGCGAGLIAPAIAQHVKWVYALDISRNHIQYAESHIHRLGINNVSCHHMGYADFSAVKDAGVTKLFSTAVFIHFNFWDIICYLEEIYKILEPGGCAQVDICNYDEDDFDFLNDPLFKTSLAAYKERHSATYLVTWHSIKAVLKVGERIGFDSSVQVKWPSGNTSVLFKKR